jgi:hypothetical protein
LGGRCPRPRPTPPSCLCYPSRFPVEACKGVLLGARPGSRARRCVCRVRTAGGSIATDKMAVGPSSSFGQASLPVFPTPAPHRVSAPSVRDRVPFSLSVLPREIIMKRRSDESSTRRTPLRAHLLFLDYSSAAGAAGPGNLRPRQWEMGRPGCNMPADSVELSATDSLAFPSFV